MGIDKLPWKKLKWKLQKNGTCYIERILEETPHETTAVRPHTSHQ